MVIAIGVGEEYVTVGAAALDSQPFLRLGIVNVHNLKSEENILS